MSRRFVSQQDAIALVILLSLTALVLWNRLTFDLWLTRYDIYTQFLPWYHHLGERLRAFDIPGWNPHLFSGVPFAGHPLTGWMYLPAMIVFPLLPVLTAFKTMIAIHLIVAATSTYAFTRVLGMGPGASLVAAIVFAFGPFLEWNTYCCLQFAHFATWVPLALLGIELAVRARAVRDRIVPWMMSGFAISQMLGGWVGEGWIYTILLPLGYVGYRTVLSPPRAASNLRERFTLGTITTIAIFGIGFGLGAAGVLPRLAANTETRLAGGDYSELGAAGILNQPWTFDYLITQIIGMGTGYHFRAIGLGGAVIVLMLLAPLLARARFAVPFFAVLTVIALTLTLNTTPLHELFYLIPRYEALHVHDPWRVVALAGIGPAVMSGAAVESLQNWWGRRRFLVVAVIPLAVIASFAWWQQLIAGVIGWAPLIAAATVTVAVLVVIVTPRYRSGRTPYPTTPYVALVLIVFAVFMQPTGLELTQAAQGWPNDRRWEDELQPDRAFERALEIEVSDTDSGGAGEFLQEQLAVIGPFRYIGYGGAGYPNAGWTSKSYMDRRFDPATEAILANGRPMFLGLYEIQGYDPIQLSRYVEFMAALNDHGQDYHTAFFFPNGTRSDLINLLNVRYVLVDASLPLDRDDVAALTAGRPRVFSTDRVIIYGDLTPPQHAWIVHDVRTVQRGDALPLLTSDAIDPRTTALVEGPLPSVQPASDPEAESVHVTQYEPDAITIEATATAPGLLVVSEVYAEGWRAYVDDRPVDILPTDHILRGIPISAGNHMVELRYEPWSLQLGLAITGATTLVMLAAFTWSRLRHPSAGQSTMRSRCSPTARGHSSRR